MKRVNSNIAYDHIRQRILNGSYAPNHALNEKELAREIGVSRSPVRRAFHLLELEGLVSTLPGMGASVKAMELKEFREMCSMRLALEAHAAGLAAHNRTEDDLNELRFALESLRGIYERIIAKGPDRPGFAELAGADIRFHIAIMTAAKNDLMKKEILRLHLINRVVTGVSPSAPESPVRPDEDERHRAVLEGHEEIFRAIERGDVAAAKEAMERHILDIIDTHLRIMTRERNAQAARQLTEEELVYMV
jgi:DNA-binding GntR family transcriptional regulator